ncbi:MAG: tRNA (adenosine(37)-N6)-threonylcarbamoyltransferase complex ATPase subunit type 1 TsaE [bacterium]|nr:tRNA (adenosine(37)-N6)-threonylcarbamoyltransferase complex ATPase subunit type 1 TsaE [bacterium]
MEVKLADLTLIAHKVLNELVPGDVLALSGPLASGKTTLTQHILQQMGYEGRVTSPTFVLEHHYPVDHNGIREVVHLDFYRLTSEGVTTFGWKDYLDDKSALTIVEWPEIGLEHLPKNIKTIKLEVIDDQTRDFLFSKNIGI